MSAYTARECVSLCVCVLVCWQSALPVSFQCFATNCCQLQEQHQQQQQPQRSAWPRLEFTCFSCRFFCWRWRCQRRRRLDKCVSADTLRAAMYVCVCVSLTALAPAAGTESACGWMSAHPLSLWLPNGRVLVLLSLRVCVCVCGCFAWVCVKQK